MTAARAFGSLVLARNGRRAGAVGRVAALLGPTELHPYDRVVVRFPDGECISYRPEDIDPSARAKVLSGVGSAQR